MKTNTALMIKRALPFLLTFLTSLSFAQNGKLQGTIKDAITEEPLEEVLIQIVNRDLQAFTDKEGYFSFEGLELGRVEVKVSSVGYGSKLVKEILLKAGRTEKLALFLESEINQLEEVAVTSSSPNLSGALTSIQSISIEQVMRLPATFYDPARLAFTFPGVAANNDQANGMSIRGNNPNGLQWRLEGVEIVNPNHLASAGTFSDQPAANSGGTNMLSAQMLGHMNFLTGAFPAEYGNAFSGVMDMRLRKGDDKEYKHTIQAGLIGIDLSSEGPLSKKNGSSYLINYRYSFTGLLALGGLTFGGEAIKFQDLAVNLSFPTKNAGDFTLFGMGGINSNEFAFEDEEGLGRQEEKDFFTIDSYGRMGVMGATHQLNFKRNLAWKTTLAYSVLENERDQIADLSEAGNGSFNDRSKLSFTTNVKKKLRGNAHVKAGFFITQNMFNVGYSEINGDAFAVRNNSLIFQPYLEYGQALGEKVLLNLGVHHVNYAYNKAKTFEPRASFAYAVGASSSINLAYGRHSQVFSFLLEGENAPYISDQFVANWSKNLGENSNFKVEGFYQNNTSETRYNVGTYFNYMNVANDLDLLRSIDGLLSGSEQSRNYGLEFSYQRYLSKGFFAIANTTLYKSEFMANEEFVDGKYDGNYIFNLTLGKEWQTKKDNTLGVNTRVVWLGGFNEYPIDLAASEAASTTIFDYNSQLTEQFADFFRPDIRVYYRKNKGTKNVMWSLDIQNVANYQNVAFKYYDALKGEVQTKYQLGLIPMINYRIEF